MRGEALPIQEAIQKARVSRRGFIAASAAATAVLATRRPLHAAETVLLPFANGERELVAYPQKRPLIRLTSRPPQLETPLRAFDEGALTANDAFFVRYHLTVSPPAAELLEPGKFTLQVKGSVEKPLNLSVADLKANFDSVQITAVNQCSGNSRGFVQPRVTGGQSGHGMMGNARWKGVSLKAVLAKAGLKAGAKQVTFDGLDKGLLPQTPDFVKALEVDHAMDGEVMLAFEMNGEPLPWLNGFPLRLVVPGYYGTYWVKHLSEIEVLDRTYEGYWMNPAYRIPDNDCACVPPGTKPSKTVPIGRYNVRSFITSLQDGENVRSSQPLEVRGFAFDGGEGIREVLFSQDGGRNWAGAELGEDLGRYSFRRWKAQFRPKDPGPYRLQVRAINRVGHTQPAEALWNPAGYMRNVIETVTVSAA
ncbi:MAG TPA: molybdopterin-dependent oxidoreductase [Verrucomicrobiae bacterium]|nr:molybdopterin-dependent oxidoreductase [Verrucomicrobiae bacterium]